MKLAKLLTSLMARRIKRPTQRALLPTSSDVLAIGLKIFTIGWDLMNPQPTKSDLHS